MFEKNASIVRPAAVMVEGVVRIVTDMPEAILSRRIDYLRFCGGNTPDDILIVTRDEETAQRFRQNLHAVFPAWRIDSLVHDCIKAVQGPLAALGFSLRDVVTPGLARLVCDSVLNQIRPETSVDERQQLLEYVLAAKQSDDYTAMILSGQFDDLPEGNLAEACLKGYLRHQHQYGLLDYDDILMILLDVYSPVPVKYLLVEDAARYSYWELLLLRRLGRHITFLQYPFQEITGHDPEQFAEIFSNCTEITLSTTAQFQW